MPRYGDFAAMFEALLKANGESWHSYNVVDDQWPAEGVLDTYKVRGQLTVDQVPCPAFALMT